MSEKEFLSLGNIISALTFLQIRIQKSGFERTTGLRSHMGEDCPFYRKSLGLFRKKDLREIRELVSTLDRTLESFERL